MTAALGLDAEGVQDRLGHLDPAQRGVADLVDVDDLAGDGLVLRRGERDVLGAGLDPLDGSPAEQLAAARDLVQEGEDRAAAWRSAPLAAASRGGAGYRRLRAADVRRPRRRR